MPQYDWASPEHQALYELPIKTLGLSVEAINALERTGIEYVGDCVDHLQRSNDGMGPIRHDYLESMEIMKAEVKPKLEAHGYWPPNAPDAD